MIKADGIYLFWKKMMLLVDIIFLELGKNKIYFQNCSHHFVFVAKIEPCIIAYTCVLQTDLSKYIKVS